MDRFIQQNTEQNINIFSEDIINSFIFNIPHSSYNIPYTEKYTSEFFTDDINKSTDWYTDMIFNIGLDTHIANVSRVFCDMERLIVNEPMEKIGKGYYYYKDDNGNEYRNNEDEEEKKYIYDNYYVPYHESLITKIDDKINKYSVARIIDCHSFNGDNFNNSPDICIGIDEYHTPKYLENFIVNKFKDIGYSVEVDYPYKGSFVPQRYYKNNKNVESIMIEINKSLYLIDNNKNDIDNNKFITLKNNIKKIFEL